MKNGILKQTILWLLIVSPVWWTSGCFSYQEITDLNDLDTVELQVTTKGGNHYTFERWTVDKIGGIAGSYTWRSPRSYSDYETKEISVTLPRDSIARTYCGKEIEVVTKGNNVYDFSEWSSSGANAIEGQARWQNPYYDSSSENARKYKEGYLTLPADSIKAINTAQLDVPLTVLAGVGVLAATFMVVFIILYDLHPFPW